MTATMVERSPALLPGRETLLEGCILAPSRLIDEKPAEQSRARPGGGAKPGVAAYRAKYRAAPCADRRAGQSTLLGRCHVGAGGGRQCDGRKQH
jgi:hypothetical protein